MVRFRSIATAVAGIVSILAACVKIPDIKEPEGDTRLVCTIADNDGIGFRDEKFDKIFGGRDKMPGYLVELDRKDCLDLFEEYRNLDHEQY